MLKVKKAKSLTNTLARGGGKGAIKRDLSKFEVDGRPIVAFNSGLEVNYMSLNDSVIRKHYPLIHELEANDKIVVRLQQKCCKADVIEIVSNTRFVYLSFEEYPLIYDEYQPSNLVRFPNGDEIPPDGIKPGLVVIDISNSNVRHSF
jgi:hypothetical protein